MNNPSSSLKGPLIALASALALSSIGLGGYMVWYVKGQNQKIERQQSELQKMKELETGLKENLTGLEDKYRKASSENESLKQTLKDQENEKNVILNQVRNSVSSFETFRAEARGEIDRLKVELESLQKEKNTLAEVLSSVQDLSEAEKKNLQKEIGLLHGKIDDHRQMQAKLEENLQKKDKVAVLADAAKIHYNLGNFYFRNGQHHYAAEEYKKALFYQPNDLDANFNLAVVADDYLEDRKTAIRHYQRYLEIQPDAKDRLQIEERIMDLELRDTVYVDDTFKKEELDWKAGQAQKARKDLEKKGQVFKEPKTGLSNFSFAGDKK